MQSPGLKTWVGLALCIAVGTAGYAWHRRATEKDRMIAEQKRVIAELEHKLDRVWAEELVADVRVDEVGPDSMHLTFVQYEPGSERPALTKDMVLPGQEFYLDALVVRFERKLVETGDGLRGKSLLLFRRAFGDRQEPANGVPLFRTDSAPQPAADSGDVLIPELAQVDSAPSAFEREIWTRFWDYANDPKRAAEAGISVAQGEAPHVKPVAGQVYKVTLRASGGLEITPRLPAALVDHKSKRSATAPARR